ncbi:MAG: hypothetical protein KAY37_05330 [Phycisphaerae bacterium]|nr:hypothetical protein [Phycisphaerae bacterium]
MLLADLVIVWVGVVLLVGFVGFFVIVIGAVLRFFAFLFRPLFRNERRLRRHAEAPPMPAARFCENPRCGCLNPGGARYCARCGHVLGPVTNVDSYG